MATPRTKVDKDHPLNPDMIEVNPQPPLEPAPEPNNTAEDTVSATNNPSPTNDEDIEDNPKIDSNPKTTTIDPPDTSDPTLPAPTPSKDAPQHIKDLLLDALTTLLITPNQSLALTMQQSPLEETHPYKIKVVTLTYDWKQHDINTPAKNLNPTQSSISKVQRSAHRKSITISFPSKTRESHNTLDKDAYEYFKTTSAYIQNPNIIPMSDQFIDFLSISS